MNIHLCAEIGDERLSNRARVCMCVGLTNGATVGDVVLISGYSANVVQMALLSALRLGYVSRKRVGKGFVYHLGKSGRAYIESERARVANEALALIARARLVRWARLGLLDEMESSLRLD